MYKSRIVISGRRILPSVSVLENVAFILRERKDLHNIQTRKPSSFFAETLSTNGVSVLNCHFQGLSGHLDSAQNSRHLLLK